MQPWPPTAACYDLSTIFSINGLAACAAFKPIHSNSNSSAGSNSSNHRSYGNPNAGGGTGGVRPHHNGRHHSSKMNQQQSHGHQSSSYGVSSRQTSLALGVQGPAVSAAAVAAGVVNQTAVISENGNLYPTSKMYHSHSQTTHSTQTHHSNRGSYIASATTPVTSGASSLLPTSVIAPSQASSTGPVHQSNNSVVNNNGNNNRVLYGTNTHRTYHAYTANPEFGHRKKSQPDSQNRAIAGADQGSSSFAKNAPNGYAPSTMSTHQMSSLPPTGQVQASNKYNNKNRMRKKKEDGSASFSAADRSSASPSSVAGETSENNSNSSSSPASNGHLASHKVALKKSFNDEKKQFDFQANAFPPLPGSNSSNAGPVTPTTDLNTSSNSSLTNKSAEPFDGGCLADVVKGNHKNCAVVYSKSNNKAMDAKSSTLIDSDLNKEQSEPNVKVDREEQIYLLKAFEKNPETIPVHANSITTTSTSQSFLNNNAAKSKTAPNVAVNPSASPAATAVATVVTIGAKHSNIDEQTSSHIDTIQQTTNSSHLIAAKVSDSKISSADVCVISQTLVATPESAAEAFAVAYLADVDCLADDSNTSHSESAKSPPPLLVNGHETDNSAQTPKKLLSYSDVAKLFKNNVNGVVSTSPNNSADAKDDKKESLSSNASTCSNPPTSSNSLSHSNSEFFK